MSGSGEWGAFMTSSCDDQPFSCALLFASAYAHIFCDAVSCLTLLTIFIVVHSDLCVIQIPFVDVLQYSCCYIQNLYFLFIYISESSLALNVHVP